MARSLHFLLVMKKTITKGSYMQTEKSSHKSSQVTEVFNNVKQMSKKLSGVVQQKMDEYPQFGIMILDGAIQLCDKVTSLVENFEGALKNKSEKLKSKITSSKADSQSLNGASSSSNSGVLSGKDSNISATNKNVKSQNQNQQKDLTSKPMAH
jgi:hypothetical protein